MDLLVQLVRVRTSLQALLGQLSLLQALACMEDWREPI